MVYASAELPWIEADWQALSEPEQEAKLATFLQSDRTQGFRLDQPPLMRCALFQLSPERHHFVWSHHHLLMDGWCNALLIKEVLAFYTAQRQGQALTLAPPHPYRDYILWLQQQDQQAARTYWQQALDGFTAPTPLGIDRSRPAPAIPYSEHCDQWHTLSPLLTADLNAFAQRHHLTLNTLFQGAWARVLSRYSGTSEVVFGATVAGRPPTLLGSDSIVGLFINTVPVRVALLPERSRLPWLTQIQDDQRDRETYAFSSLTDIQSWSDVPHDMPLFESLLVFENYPVSLTAALTDDSSSLTIQAGQGFEQTNYPLALVVIPGETLALRVNYDHDRFPAAAIQRLLGHLETVLTRIMADPEASIGTLSLMTPIEQSQFQHWNQTEQSISNRCVHELIADRATANPNATAVIFEDISLSYQELDQRANQLAHHLIQQGVQPGDRVALCLERSAELVIALLAILKTGATYVPLDPTYPVERLRFILEDAQVSLLVTVGGETLGAAHPTVPTLNLDDATEAITQQSHPVTQQPSYSPTPPDLAYLIYTSGSTGTPKGVPIQHQSLTNLLISMSQAPGMTAQDALLAVTTPAFDIATLELFLPLTVGGTLVIASQEAVRDPQQLATQLEQYDVTLMQATPATWRLLLESGWQGKANLKLLCGGEALDIALAKQLLECGAELWNLYGPTETTIWSAALRLDASILADGLVPIGPPIANTQFHVLDAQQRPVPFGVPGELHIGGLGLSSGYWQREDLTVERFIEVEDRRQKGIGNKEHGTGSTQNPERGQNPSTHPPIYPSTLYKTGDRVRIREDGTLEYLGRLDHQVKLRGFRIELGEIEAVLAQHPDVSQAVVLLREDNTGESQLIAYVVSHAGDTRKIEEEPKVQGSRFKAEPRHPRPETLNLKSQPFSNFLAQHLPAYMVPTQFVMLDALPLTPNGKVDRKALPPRY
ncbi:MAG: amino acid adenylation domain-containing protein [Cyanobacteria bacterium J06607_6]